MCGRIVVVQDPVTIPPFSPVVFGELIHANVAIPPGRIPCYLFALGSVLVVYDTLRIKKRQFLDVDGRPERRSLSKEVFTYFMEQSPS